MGARAQRDVRLRFAPQVEPVGVGKAAGSRLAMLDSVRTASQAGIVTPPRHTSSLEIL
jgi:hypothetical protein